MEIGMILQSKKLYFSRHYNTHMCWDFSAGPVFENSLYYTGDTGLIPGQETKILYVHENWVLGATTPEPMYSGDTVLKLERSSWTAVK